MVTQVLWLHAGCGKPAFFNSRKPMFEVQTSSGMLRNTDSGNPMVPIGLPPPPHPRLVSQWWICVLRSNATGGHKCTVILRCF